MTKKEKIEKFLTYSGFRLDIKEDKEFGDDHEIVLIVANSFIIGFYIPDNAWFLQAIVSNPGNRDEPPSEDYAEICTNKDFSVIALKLTECIAKDTLEIMNEEEMGEMGEGA